MLEYSYDMLLVVGGRWSVAEGRRQKAEGKKVIMLLASFFSFELAEGCGSTNRYIIRKVHTIRISSTMHTYVSFVRSLVATPKSILNGIPFVRE